MISTTISPIVRMVPVLCSSGLAMTLFQVNIDADSDENHGAFHDELIRRVLEQIAVERHGSRSESRGNLSICAAQVKSQAPRAAVHLVPARYLARALDQTLQ